MPYERIMYPTFFLAQAGFVQYLDVGNNDGARTASRPHTWRLWTRRS